MATAEDDGIEILSCHIEHDDETTENSSNPSVKIPNGNLGDDPVTKQRKRVARVVGAVTFILLLFSVVLIGVSLNMSKNIDEMGECAGGVHVFLFRFIFCSLPLKQVTGKLLGVSRPVNRYGYIRVILKPVYNNNNHDDDDDEYLERLTRTSPKRLQILLPYIY